MVETHQKHQTRSTCLSVSVAFNIPMLVSICGTEWKTKLSVFMRCHKTAITSDKFGGKKIRTNVWFSSNVASVFFHHHRTDVTLLRGFFSAFQPEQTSLRSPVRQHNLLSPPLPPRPPPGLKCFSHSLMTFWTFRESTSLKINSAFDWCRCYISSHFTVKQTEQCLSWPDRCVMLSVAQRCHRF